MSLDRAHFSAGGLRLSVVVLVLFVAMAAGLMRPHEAGAFKAGGHWALATTVAKQLPDGNRIKAAMLAQPDCVAWGSNGPDLAGSLPEMAIERVPWFDVYHYHSVGAYARELLREALASNDDRKIAFAAGWVTHVVGDMSVHGLLVNPETGVYIDRGSDHEFHGSLEAWADPVIWTDFAGLPQQDLRPCTSSTSDNESTKLYKRFVGNQGFGTLTVPGDGSLENLVDTVNWRVIRASGGEDFTYLNGDYFGPAQMRTAYTIFGEVMAAENASIISSNPLAGVVSTIRDKAKLYWSLADGRANLEYTGSAYGGGGPLPTKRIDRLRAAWRQSKELSTLLLEDATRGDYSWFSDAWVADAGLNDGRAMGSLRLVVVTGGGSHDFLGLDGGGTNHYPYFGMEFDDGTVREWKLEQNGYDDFEMGDRDVYYLNCYENIPVWRVTRIYMRLGTDQYGPDLPWWNLQAFNVYVNDRCVYWLQSGSHWTESGTRREATWYGGNGLDAMVSHGWPTGPDQALTQAPRRMWWDMPSTPIIAGQPAEFGAHIVNADKLPGHFYFYRPDGSTSMDLTSTAGVGANWGDRRITYPVSVPTSRWMTIQFGGPDDGGASAWVPNPLSQRRYVTEEQWTVDGDFNGDRRGDVVRLSGGSSLGMWLFSSKWGAFKVAKAGALDLHRPDVKALAGDLDGDRRDELCLLRRQAGGGVELWKLDLANGVFGAKKVWQEPAPGWDWERVKPICADTDGDGRDELWCAYDYDGWDNIDTGLIRVKVGATSATASRVWQTQNGWYDWNLSSFLAGDFDGDGADEIGGYYEYGSGKTGFWMWKRQADGTLAHTRPWYVDSGWNFAATKARVGDFDGDGKDEIMNLRMNFALVNYMPKYSTELWLMDDLAVQGGVTNSMLWTSTTDGSDPYRMLAASSRPLAGDVDGDGKAEFMALQSKGGEATSEAFDLLIWNEGIGSGGPLVAWSKSAGVWSATTVPAASQAYVVDATAPTTVAVNHPLVHRGRTLALRYRVDDLPPTLGMATVKITIKNRAGRTVRTLALGKKAVNVTLSAKLRCSLPVGRYSWRVTAVDAAGLKQSSTGKNTFTVVR
jgi:hypothetical protein